MKMVIIDFFLLMKVFVIMEYNHVFVVEEYIVGSSHQFASS